MALQGPIVVVSEAPAGRLVSALGKAGAFPIVEARWVDAVAAVTSIQPAAIVIAELEAPDPKTAAALERRISLLQPYAPVIMRVRENTSLPFPTVLPIAADAPNDRLIARLAAAMRVRDLHATMLRRAETIAGEGGTKLELPKTDPLEDASVLVLGRGRNYPTLSVAVGERVGVVGAMSVEAAGKLLIAREIDGIVIGDGFSSKIIDAFLFVLADDARFRDLPVAVLGEGAGPEQMPNFSTERDPARLVERMLPFVRLHAFDARLKRMLKTLETKGMVDPETGLFNEEAFGQDLTRAIEHVGERGGGLSIARFSFEGPLDRRSSLDAARVVSRLMRKVDFACRQEDGSILTVFTGTDLRSAHVVARRLANVLKHTMLRAEHGHAAIGPNVTLATLKASDTLVTLTARVNTRAVAAE
jgi:GGDEF domain-containing protein